MGESDDVTLWSDGCTYQNRNTVLSNGLLSVAMQKKITIYQKYLVRGHTQMECDSMHSTIERRLGKATISVPADYEAVFRSARIGSAPYRVTYVDHSFFKDYSKLQHYTSIRPGSGAGAPVVTDIVALCYKPTGIIEYKLNFDDEWRPLPVRRSARKTTVVADISAIKPLYSGSLSIKADKFVHLKQLKKELRKDYHPFYDALQHHCTASPDECPHFIDPSD